MPMPITPSNMAHLNTMATNLEEMLSSIKGVHGEAYHSLIICLLGNAAASIQLAQIAEDATRFILLQEGKNSPDGESISSATQVATSNLALIESNFNNISQALSGVCSILEESGSYPELKKNLDTMIQRVQDDFLSKIQS